MMDGQGFQVFILEDLLRIWPRCAHGEELNKATSYGLLELNRRVEIPLTLSGSASEN